jgi:hypothetical protein
MRRWVASLAAVASLLFATPALARAPDVHLRVSPLVGAPDTTFRAGFNSPSRLYYRPPAGDRLGYFTSLAITATHDDPDDDCSSSLIAGTDDANRGERVRLALSAVSDLPPCSGLYHGTVELRSGYVCDERTQVCPASPEFARVLARFRLVVSALPNRAAARPAPAP